MGLDQVRQLIARIHIGRLDRTRERHILFATGIDGLGCKRGRIVDRCPHHVDLLIDRCAPRIGNRHHKTIRPVGVERGHITVGTRTRVDRHRARFTRRLDRVALVVPCIHIGSPDGPGQCDVLGPRHRDRGKPKAWFVVDRCPGHSDRLLGLKPSHVARQHYEAVLTIRIGRRLIRVSATDPINRDRARLALRLDRVRHLVARIHIGRLDRTRERHILGGRCRDRGSSKSW